MNRDQDKIIIAVMVTLSALFAISAVITYSSETQARNVDDKPTYLNVSASEVIGPTSGLLGDPSSLVTVVEFGDYQCPPCRAANKVFRSLPEKYHVRIAFRNCPLTTIHRFAFRAAVEAEKARIGGRFWEVHDRLYAIPPEKFDSHSIQQAAKLPLPGVPVTNVTAERAVNSDVAEAQRLHIQGTPTFIVCDQHGRVAVLKGLDHIAEYVRN
jgi:protein-disulfide isomerase